jgi:hypothetical protein
MRKTLLLVESGSYSSLQVAPASGIFAKALWLIAFLILFLFSLPRTVAAQPGPQKGAPPTAAGSQTPSSSQPTGSPGLQGISFAKDSWETSLGKLPTPEELGIKDAKEIVVLCYTLVPGNSASQPFILESHRGMATWRANTSYSAGDLVLPQTSNDHYYAAANKGKSGPKEPNFQLNAATVSDGQNLSWKDMGQIDTMLAGCSNITPTQPLLMNQMFVVAIDMRKIPQQILDRFQILNLNVTNQQGAPLNPTPIRPGIAAPTATGPEISAAQAAAKEGKKKAQVPKICYLTWPNQMPGDTIPTLSVNLVYTPVAPGLPWQPKTFYPAGSIVIPNTASVINGHYYLALNSGISSGTAPGFDSAAVPVLTFPDGTGQGLAWKEMGLTTVYPAPTTWQANLKYAKGSHVTPTTPNGYYYEAESDGVSGPKAPAFPIHPGDSVPDGPSTSKLSWQNKGLTNVNPATIPAWQPGVAYAQGALVVPPNPPNGHYYEATIQGVSGPNPPPFPTKMGDSVTEASKLLWEDVGSTLPASFKNLKTWAPNTAFFVGDVIQDASSGHYWTVIQAGISDSKQPPSSALAPKQVADDSNSPYPIEWQDLGTALPASVSPLGTTPSDQTVSLLNYTLPQVHALSYFNLATGVVVSSIKSPTFVNTNGSTAASPNWTKVTNGLTVDPILALSVYVKPLDAERPFQMSNLIPAPTIAFSLSSPTTNYYFGGSSEFFFRNIQLVYGVSLSRVPSLLPAAQQMSATAPATRQVFAHGGFVGVSFNILGFIQSLF